MQTGRFTKALILACFGLLLGVIAYGVISGDAPGTPEPQGEDDMEDGDKVVQLNDTLIQEIEAIAEYYNMSMDEAIEFLLKIGINEQLGFIEQAKAWDNKVKELE